MTTAKAALPREKNKRSTAMDEIEVVLRRFGDEQSNLLDQFEILSFEVQLNQAIMQRSLSESNVPRSKFQAPSLSTVSVMPPVTKEVRQGRRRGSGFGKLLKKLLKPILGSGKSKNKNNDGGRMEVTDPGNPKYYKNCSRSLRF